MLVRELSAAQQKIVQITRALANEAKVLVLDEDLTAEQAELATKEVLAEIIGETVEENGGFVDVEFYNLFVEGNFTVLSEDHYKYSADYGGYLAISDEMG